MQQVGKSSRYSAQPNQHIDQHIKRTEEDITKLKVLDIPMKSPIAALTPD